MERTPLTLAPDLLVAELSAVLADSDPRGVVLAFDGDGTLWGGDVGEDLFHAALRESFLLDDAYPALRAESERHGVPVGPAESSANALASVLFASYLAGQYPERETCAMMTWCYAGRRLDEVRALAVRVLEQSGMPGRLTPELSPIVEWSRQAGVRRVVISASPRVIVEPASAYWGFEPQDVAAATPRVLDGVVQAQLEGAVPYAESKLTAGKALFGSARWLAAFGDNVFDIDMLATAELGVAVRPKPRLASQLAALGLRLLATPPDASARASAR